MVIFWIGPLHTSDDSVNWYNFWGNNLIICVILENICRKESKNLSITWRKDGCIETIKSYLLEPSLSSSDCTGAWNQDSYIPFPSDWPILHLCVVGIWPPHIWITLLPNQQKHPHVPTTGTLERDWWAKLWSAFTLGPIRCCHRTQKSLDLTTYSECHVKQELSERKTVQHKQMEEWTWDVYQ